MGLPLYIAPVESDIPAKPAPSSIAHARSSIRRLRQRSEAAREAVRDSRRRALAAAAAYQNAADPWLMRSRSASNEPNSALSTSNPGPNSSTTRGSNRAAQDSLRDLIGGRMGGLDDRVVALFGERWANLHARSNPSPARDETDVVLPPLIPIEEPLNAPSERWDLDSTSLRRANSQGETEPSTSRLPRSRSPPPLRRVHSRDVSFSQYLARRGGSRRVEPTGRPARSSRPLRSVGQVERLQEARFDGLGDRDRSLSPEGDGVWDTLLSTLTPDPQPPSVGSSFASASASAAASQSGPAGSSSTSLTGPDTAEESGFEHPCESGCENSDTEGDDDEETIHLVQMLAGHRRSYADVAAQNASQNSNSSDDPLELLGGIGGMQHIVRNLARREDIPDEWWAEAGLSRALPREASS